MYTMTGLGRGGGGGGHGGGGHGGGGHGGGARGGAMPHGGAPHGGGGGFRPGGHHGGRRPGGVTNVFVSDGGWGPGWGPGWYEPVVAAPTCAVYDVNGVCVCAELAADGTCLRPLVGFIRGAPVYGLGADDGESSATPWIAGGLLLALAVGAYALDKKGPKSLRRARA